MLKWVSSLPISFKLMVTTTLLLMFTVGLYGAMNVQNLGAVYDESSDEQQDLLLQAVVGEARNVTTLLAFSARQFVAATAYGDIQALLDTLTADDERFIYARVYDGDQVGGVRTGAPAALRVLEHPRFLAGDVDTHLLEGMDLSVVSETEQGEDTAGAVSAAI